MKKRRKKTSPSPPLSKTHQQVEPSASGEMTNTQAANEPTHAPLPISRSFWYAVQGAVAYHALAMEIADFIIFCEQFATNTLPTELSHQEIVSKILNFTVLFQTSLFNPEALLPTTGRGLVFLSVLLNKLGNYGERDYLQQMNTAFSDILLQLVDGIKHVCLYICQFIAFCCQHILEAIPSSLSELSQLAASSGNVILNSLWQIGNSFIETTSDVPSNLSSDETLTAPVCAGDTVHPLCQFR